MADLGPFALGRVHCGDCLEMMRQLPDGCIQCVVTSPPYWGLRDYGVPGQWGMEKTPQEYVEKMVTLGRELRRVLRKDGTFWLNLGDSYSSQPGQRKTTDGAGRKQESNTGSIETPSRIAPGLKPKDLCMIPARVALALQADGWWLRSDIIWSKPNPMPESVTDRPTKSHEYVFLLTKSERYYYDAEAVAEDSIRGPHTRNRASNFKKAGNVGNHHQGAATIVCDGTRNLRSVWTITTKPYKEAHFATFPPELPERCIKAGSKPGDVVLDPFMGSGTTGEVALRLGRQCLGFDLNPAYCGELAQPRMDAAAMGLTLAEHRAGQGQLFGGGDA